MRIGLSLSLLGALLGGASIAILNSPIALAIAFLIYATGAGIIPAHASAEILHLFPNNTASAQSLMSAVGTLFGAFFSLVSISIPPTSPIGLSLLLIALSLAACLSFKMWRGSPT